MHERPYLAVLLSICCLVACGDKREQNKPTAELSEASSTPLKETAASYSAPGPAHVSDAEEGQALAAERRLDTPVDPDGQGWRYPARVEPITWDYGNCTNARTLIPSPMQGWGILNDMSVGEWPIEEGNARFVLTKSGAPLEPPSLGLSGSNDSMSIYISSGTATTKSLQDMLANPQLQETFFEPGPYNYPVRKGLPGEAHYETLLGPYRVLMGGNKAYDGEYFRQVIKCAIDSGLIDESVDAALLRATP